MNYSFLLTRISWLCCLLFSSGTCAAVQSVAVANSSSSSSNKPALPVLLKVFADDRSINVSWRPGDVVDKDEPVGDEFVVLYRKKNGADGEWKRFEIPKDAFVVVVPDLDAGSKYEVRVGAVQNLADGEKTELAESPSQIVHTKPVAVEQAGSTLIFWFIVILIIILVIIIIILCLVCLLTRHRGAKYPVSEKEKKAGREPMIAKEPKGFGEYMKPDDEEKKSLTGGSRGESETDSMAEYGDGETGRFTEDGSFIGQYVPTNRILVTDPRGATSAGKGAASAV